MLLGKTEILLRGESGFFNEVKWLYSVIILQSTASDGLANCLTLWLAHCLAHY